jgi:hypothetical protein
MVYRDIGICIDQSSTAKLPAPLFEQRSRPPGLLHLGMPKLPMSSRRCSDTLLQVATARLALLTFPSELLKRFGDLFLRLIAVLLHN